MDNLLVPKEVYDKGISKWEAIARGEIPKMGYGRCSYCSYCYYLNGGCSKCILNEHGFVCCKLWEEFENIMHNAYGRDWYKYPLTPEAMEVAKEMVKYIKAKSIKE